MWWKANVKASLESRECAEKNARAAASSLCIVLGSMSYAQCEALLCAILEDHGPKPLRPLAEGCYDPAVVWGAVNSDPCLDVRQEAYGRDGC